MGGITTLWWCEFLTKGARGGSGMWHLVLPEGESYRSLCGCLLTEKPQNRRNNAPDVIRGVCRRCAKLSQNKAIPPGSTAPLIQIRSRFALFSSTPRQALTLHCRRVRRVDHH